MIRVDVALLRAAAGTGDERIMQTTGSGGMIVKHREERDLFQAVLAVAGADGRISRSERGLLESLAVRVGVGGVSLNAMIDRATREPGFRTDRNLHQVEDPLKAMELLVATARIDGEISEEERSLLVRIADIWEIANDTFLEVFNRGLATADRLRAQRTRSGAD